MSIRLMTLVWDIHFPTQAQKLIALRLADYAADSGGSVWPSRETLAEKVGCNESTVKRTLKAFRECGLLQLIREGGSGPKDTNEWQLNVGLMCALAQKLCKIVGGSEALEIDGEWSIEAVDKKGVILPPLESTRGSSGELRGSSCPAKGVASDPQSTTNHQIDSSMRASAREKVKSDLRSEVGNRVAITITKTGDGPEWRAWIEWLIAKGMASAAEAAESAGKITAPSRWPKHDSPIPKISRLQASMANRIVGDAA